jgi:hypothetical protein
MNDVVKVIQALDAVFSLAISAGVNMERYRNLKDANAGGPLTPEQLDELDREARRSVDRL